MRLPQPAHSLAMQFVFGAADTDDVLTPAPLLFADALLFDGIALCPIAAAAAADAAALPLIEFLFAPNDTPVAVILFAWCDSDVAVSVTTTEKREWKKLEKIERGENENGSHKWNGMCGGGYLGSDTGVTNIYNWN